MRIMILQRNTENKECKGMGIYMKGDSQVCLIITDTLEPLVLIIKAFGFLSDPQICVMSAPAMMA